MHTELLLGKMTDAIDVSEYYSIQTGAEGAKVRLPQCRQLWKLIQCYFLLPPSLHWFLGLQMHDATGPRTVPDSQGR